MRIALALDLVACGTKTADRTTPISNIKVTTIEAATAPAAALAADGWTPPMLVFVDAKGEYQLAAAASWSELAAGKLSAGPKPASLLGIQVVLQERARSSTPKQMVDAFIDVPIEDTTGRESNNTDDPLGWRDEDEAGGVGTAMALEEEGRMGRKTDDPEAGNVRGGRGFGMTGDPNEPMRLAFVVGEVTSAKPEAVPAVIIPHPATNAVAVVKAIANLEAMLGVRSGDQVRPLRIQFHGDPKGPVRELDEWLEVRIDAEGLVVEAVPSKATRLTWSEVPTLGAAIAAARNSKRGDARSPVDVLVGNGITAQKLIDVLVTLDQAGISAIGLGAMPPASQLALRDRDPAPKPASTSTPSVSSGEPTSQGNLDKDIIRRYIRRNIGKIQYCYEKQLVDTPDLEGTVNVQFVIKPDGTVESSSGSGVHPAVANCVAVVVKAIEFPRPTGGGGVKVIYPFVFKHAK